MADLPLTAAQEAEAQHLYHLLKQATDDDLLQMARLLASKPNHQLLGATAFELRDRVLQIGAKAVATALGERKKGGTTAPAPPVPPAAKPPSASAGRPGPSSASSALSAAPVTPTTAPPAAKASAPSTTPSAWRPTT